MGSSQRVSIRSPRFARRNLPSGCDSRVTAIVIWLRHDAAMLAQCDSPKLLATHPTCRDTIGSYPSPISISALAPSAATGGAAPEPGAADAHSDRNRCLAPAGEWRRAHVDLAGGERPPARGRSRLSHPGGLSLVSGADLSGAALRVAEPARDRAPHRAGAARCDPHRDRRDGRLHDTPLLPAARLAFHHELYDAVSRIHLGAVGHPRELDLRRFAPLPRRGHRDDDLHALADGRIERARVRAPRHVDARRRYRAVPARTRD